MTAFPEMVQPSPASTLAFVAIVAFVCSAFLFGIWFTRTNASAGRDAARWRLGWSALGLASWLVLTALASASGLMRTFALPPPVALFLVLSLAVPVLVAFSSLGAQLASGVPVWALVAVQAFRLPLELVLHRWYGEGVLPAQMTYAGHNFDIVTGVLAIAVGSYLLLTGRAPRALVWGFNIVGSALLIAVATIAVLSSPLPIRVYLADPPVLLAAYFPYGWIVPFCVGGALLGHLLVFRWLMLHPAAASGVTK